MFCICTAGHVNHGKTSLVKSLTGLDTDRLVYFLIPYLHVKSKLDATNIEL
jgi:translation initiation factor 2 gamma subunit (eIF-2gamma)